MAAAQQQQQQQPFPDNTQSSWLGNLVDDNSIYDRVDETIAGLENAITEGTTILHGINNIDKK
jgi:hypothetical protein